MDAHLQPPGPEDEGKDDDESSTAGECGGGRCQCQERRGGVQARERERERDREELGGGREVSELVCVIGLDWTVLVCIRLDYNSRREVVP